MAKRITKISIYNKETGWSTPVPVGAEVADASTTKAGVVKLYSSTGNNTDGTMTQSAITAATDPKNFRSTIPVNKGGTGQISFTNNAVIIGNGTDGLKEAAPTGSPTQCIYIDANGKIAAGNGEATDEQITEMLKSLGA